MAATLIQGPRTWSMTRDEFGHRTYTITFRVQTDSTLDGPAIALTAPGLPVFGQRWIVDNDVDLWAWCRHNSTAKPVLDNEPNNHWDVDFTFSTKPPDSRPRKGNSSRGCKTDDQQDPLLEPPKISGGVSNTKKEATHDRFGKPILNSAFEEIRGPQVEFDEENPTVKIEMNFPTLDLGLLTSMRGAVNDRTIWGVKKRCLRLVHYTWEQKYQGVCEVYYTVSFEFHVDYNTWDRDVMDEGTKVLRGAWNPVTGNWDLINIGGSPPDPTKPHHFDRAVDRQNNLCRIILDGKGQPATLTGPGPSDTVVFGASPLTNGIVPLTGTPLRSAALRFEVTASDEFSGGDVFVGGLDDDGNTLQDTVHLTYQSVDSGIVRTKTRFKTVSLVILEQLVGNVGGADTIKCYAEDYLHNPGKIHVEKYPSKNFLLLGIPTDF